MRLVADVEPLEVHPDCTAPLGLVVNEFVTNSLRYAFGNGRGVIGMRLERTGPELAWVILWGDGRGMPARRSGGTALKLIEGLVRQVGGTPRWNHSWGVKLVIAVPVASRFGS